jgi:hypothetical protein
MPAPTPGYSGKPLAAKLGIKPGMLISTLDALASSSSDDVRLSEPQASKNVLEIEWFLILGWK